MKLGKVSIVFVFVILSCLASALTTAIASAQTVLVDESFVASASIDEYSAEVQRARDVNQRGIDDRVPLHYAVRWGSTAHIRKLLSAGADPNLKNSFGNSPLHWAASEWGTLEKVVLLVGAGADVNALTDNNETALMFSGRNPASAAIADYLLSRGADPTVVTNDGFKTEDYMENPDALKLVIEAIRQSEDTAQESADQDRPDILVEQRDSVDALAAGQPLVLSDANVPFFAGVVNGLVLRCVAPSDPGKRADLLAFATTVTTGMAFGSDYSNPNLGEAISIQQARIYSIAAGDELGKEIPCGEMADGIAEGIHDALAASKQSADGGPSAFLQNCTSVHGQSNCVCLANIGIAVIPDIHSRSYSSELVYDIIKRNPAAGLQIALVCGIQNY